MSERNSISLSLNESAEVLPRPEPLDCPLFVRPNRLRNRETADGGGVGKRETSDCGSRLIADDEVGGVFKAGLGVEVEKDGLTGEDTLLGVLA